MALLPPFELDDEEPFSPTVGWAGTEDDPESGTLVRLKGIGFDPTPENNNALFTSAEGLQTKAAKVKWRKSDEATYEYEKAFGSSGTAAGELGPEIRAIAIDPNTGGVFVADPGNERIEVYDKDGNFSRHVGIGTIEVIRGLAVDKDSRLFASGRFISPLGPRVEGVAMFGADGTFTKFFDGTSGGASARLVAPYSIAVSDTWLYVIDIGPGYGFPKVVVFDIDDSTIQGSFNEVSWAGNQLRIAVDPRSVQSPTDTIFYISDRTGKAVYKYDLSTPLIDRFDFLQADDVGRVAVDWEGFLYVDLGRDGIAKIDGNGNPRGTVISALNNTALPLRAIDTSKKLYLADVNNCDCVEVYAPTNTTELYVYVPYGARTGPITGVVNEFTNRDTTSMDFYVVDSESAVSVNKVEPTQGIWSYPFVAGKSTLIWADIQGIFGHPKTDKAVMTVTGPDGKSLEQAVDHYVYEYPDPEQRSFAHFHIPPSMVANAGQYRFDVKLLRNNELVYERLLFLDFYDSKQVHLQFIKYTDVPNEQWNLRDPFAWFDMSTFLYGIESFKRLYPIDASHVSFDITASQYKEFLVSGGGLTSSDENNSGEEDDLLNAVSEQSTAYQENALTVADFERPVGLLDPALNKTTSGPNGNSIEGACTGPNGPSFTFFNGGVDWPSVLAHELGHSFELVGLVDKNAPNADGGGHSKNHSLENEKPPMGEFRAWNVMTDWLIPLQAFSVMTPLPPNVDGIFFESVFMDTPVDYHVLADQLLLGASTSQTSSALSDSPLANLSSSSKFVIIGSIDTYNGVTIERSFITESELQQTSAETSDYSIAFLDSAGQILAADTFLPRLPVPEGNAQGFTVKLFKIVTPYPEQTVRVEIRFKDQTLKALIPSTSAPSVSQVAVEVPRFGLPRITWAAEDPDDEPLTFDIYYSTDGGTAFTPIVTGLTETEVLWDDRLTGGSDNTIVRVVANDGFHRGSASYSFSLPEKGPHAVILAPDNNEIFTQGSIITLRGSGFDPEDKVLPGSNLTWWLDNDTDLGTGGTVTISNRSIATPSGPMAVPLDIGMHSVVLRVNDSSGKENFKEIAIQIVQDSDRDGFTDSQEKELGSDPGNPYDAPMDSDGDSIADEVDNCPNDFNPDQGDSDQNGIGDACENRPPLARCKDVTLWADQNCEMFGSIDDGSFDRDSDSFTLQQTPSGPYGLGSHEVTLKVTDDSGVSSSCVGTITVIDAESPHLYCNAPATITPPDAPIAFTASVTDNCGATVKISAFDCFTYTKKGKRIDKTESCEVQVEGDTITILDSGGVGDNITWTAETTDTSGNQAVETCAVNVIRP